MNAPTDTQLKQALAKMLPERLLFIENRHPDDQFIWVEDRICLNPVLDTELLHLCWLVEETLVTHGEIDSWIAYQHYLLNTGASMVYGIHATWRQRVIALARVKGIEL